MKHARVLLFLAAVHLHAAVVADSARGAALFETLGCVQCHSVNGKGGKIGSDLGRRIDRGFTPASLAATMWNHAPAMWMAMRARNAGIGDLNEQAAADLFAYFYSVRFFERLGDGGRGKRLFAEKHCAQCHGLVDAKLPEAKPVAQWASVGNPIALVSAMWNHATTMREQFVKKGLGWSSLTTQDLADMLVYLRSLPPLNTAAGRVEITQGASGESLFTSKGCAACHSTRIPLAQRLQGATLTDIAVDLWNHEPRMPAVPAALSAVEMQELVSYLWAGQFFADQGNASAGARVFAAKGCAGCHENGSGTASKLTGTGHKFTAATMVSALWRHGPQMLDQMKSQGVRWPTFNGAEMANLIAHLNGGK